MKDGNKKLKYIVNLKTKIGPLEGLNFLDGDWFCSRAPSTAKPAGNVYLRYSDSFFLFLKAFVIATIA